MAKSSSSRCATSRYAGIAAGSRSRSASTRATHSPCAATSPLPSAQLHSVRSRPVTEPALWGLRRSLLDLTDKLHLARPAIRAYELVLAAKSDLLDRSGREGDGLQLPPARLRAQAGP